jgi:predicted MFS family arabinose efflux permease
VSSDARSVATVNAYRSSLGLFADRRFTLLFTARTCSVLGSTFAPVALAFGVLGLPDATATTLSAVLAAQAVPLVAFMLFGGVIADRFSRYRQMVGSDLLSAASFGVLAAMFITGWAPLGLIIAVAALTGFAQALFFPALTGVVPEVVAADRLQAANGMLRLGTNSARLGGYAVAGVAVVLVGPGWALAVNAGSFLFSAALLAALRLPVTMRGRGGSMLADLRYGWREFRSRQWLWVIVVQFSFIIAAFQAFMVLGPVLAKAELGGAPAWSAILAGEAAGMIVGVVIAIRIRPRRPLYVATLAILPTALPILLMGLDAPLATLVAGAFILGVMFDTFGVLWETTMQREIPPSALSRVSSYDALGSFMFGPVGLVAAGPLAALVGPRVALLICAGVVVLATLGALLSPQVRGLTAPAAPPPAASTAQRERPDSAVPAAPTTSYAKI